jgi:hypothetical protein
MRLSRPPASLVFNQHRPPPHPCSGRKNAALGYVITYSLSCCTKHSPNFWVLMVGRILGGIATSLLYSAFESWLVAEHFKRGYSGEQAACGPRWCSGRGRGST